MIAVDTVRDNAIMDFDLEEFLPYLLNQAAEVTSQSFHAIYAEKYGMTRTQWRVLANLGKFGSMSAKDICEISHMEKTKVSRAISALEATKLLRRKTMSDDRRAEALHLTATGLKVYKELGMSALHYDHKLRVLLGRAAFENLSRTLKVLARQKNAA
jgi:DNA-binding MarR family transcriptional regulator